MSQIDFSFAGLRLTTDERLLPPRGWHLAPGGAALLQLGTPQQAERLELPMDLVVEEVREYPRGVVVGLRRWSEPAASAVSGRGAP